MNSGFASKTSFAQKSKLIYEKQKLGTNKKETKSKNEKKKKKKKKKKQSALTEANKTLQFLSS